MDTPIAGTFAVLPIRNAVIFPGVALPLRVGRAKSMAAITQAHANGDWLLTVSQSRESERDHEAQLDDLYRVGTLCRIEKLRGSIEEGYHVLVRGVARFRVLEFFERNGSSDAEADDVIRIEASAEIWNDVQGADEGTTRALVESLKQVTQEVLELLPADTEHLSQLVAGIDDPAYLMNLCAGNLELPVAEKQKLLEMVSIKDRALRLLELMQVQKDGLQVKSEIRDKLSHRMGKVQRDAFLREQMRTIREELDDDDESKSGEDLRAKIESAGMPEETKKLAVSELNRLESIGNASPEAHVIRNYLDLLCALPWSRSSEEVGLDLTKARESLDRDHYGLDKVKKRIVQHLAAMKLVADSDRLQKARGSILLFVGPPGVGKTSLGESIARALGRRFVRGSLGGVRDDAEIRGHRRTYIGAMPGRIIQGIKRAGENNPVFMLDEIDKLGRGFQGDPASALLEVLDPEQNSTFLDHYLEAPFDLSKVFFIATANSLESIPGPLLDRIEVIELSGYTTAEKLHIAKTHLIPKQLEGFGLGASEFEIADEALVRIISHYTREAGVRELSRKIAEICRASTEAVLSVRERGEKQAVRIDVAGLEEILGGERFVHEVIERIASPGLVTGLAWTPQGGEILFVEAGLMPGVGKLTLTGQLGDVMKESAQIAVSLARSRLSEVDLAKKDLHIHVPAGAIPKDGPSAGVTMLTTVASLLTGRSVNPRLAMTGEITLRGAVTPVGGIKEKLIAAHRAGIERVLLPKRNERDMKDVPEEVKSQLKIDFVESAAEVLEAALGLKLEDPLVMSGLVQKPNPTTPAVA